MTAQSWSGRTSTQVRCAANTTNMHSDPETTTGIQLWRPPPLEFNGSSTYSTEYRAALQSPSDVVAAGGRRTVPDAATAAWDDGAWSSDAADSIQTHLIPCKPPHDATRLKPAGIPSNPSPPSPVVSPSTIANVDIGMFTGGTTARRDYADHSNKAASLAGRRPAGTPSIDPSDLSHGWTHTLPADTADSDSEIPLSEVPVSAAGNARAAGVPSNHSPPSPVVSPSTIANVDIGMFAGGTTARRDYADHSNKAASLAGRRPAGTPSIDPSDLSHGWTVPSLPQGAVKMMPLHQNMAADADMAWQALLAAHPGGEMIGDGIYALRSTTEDSSDNPQDETPSSRTAVFLGSTTSTELPAAELLSPLPPPTRHFQTTTAEAFQGWQLDVDERAALGVETVGDKFEVLIPADAVLPARRTVVFTTVTHNQTVVEITVLHGRSTIASKNDRLGSFSLIGLDPAPCAEPQIAVTFVVGKDLVLHVEAVDQATGREQHIAIDKLTNAGAFSNV